MNRVLTGVLLFAALSFAPPADAEPPSVRILLATDAPRAVVRGDRLVIERDVEGRWKTVLSGLSAAAFSPGPNGARLLGSDVAADRFRVHSPSGSFALDGRPLRQDLILTAREGGLTAVNALDMESYLTGVINGEVDSRWPAEAVKAQAVAARTYALYRMESAKGDFDLRGDVLDQVYSGMGSEDELAVEAVRQTRGLALYSEGSLVPAFFHSSCGGMTADAGDVWGIPHPALTSVACGDCDDAPKARWEVALTVDQIRSALAALHPQGAEAVSLGVSRRNRDGRVASISVTSPNGTFLVDAEDFRREIGYATLPSTRFTLRSEDGVVVAEGAGYGHGVGLCQWGARGAAAMGMDFAQILARYYPGAQVRRAY